MLMVNNLSKKYGNFTAVEELSFACQAGEVLGFLGPNGAGKTTTMRLITGFFEADMGQVLINGFDITKEPIQAKTYLGYLPEQAPIYPQITLLNYLRFIGGIRKLSPADLNKQLNYVLEICQLKDRCDYKLAQLSRGLRQRAELAAALLHDPAVLVLDEPTSGLDPFQRQQFRELIQELGKKKAILYSTHILSEVIGLCNRLIVINKGRIIASGYPEELAAQAGIENSRIVFCFKGTADKDDFSFINGILEMEVLPTIKSFNGSAQKFSRFQFKVKTEDSHKISQALGKLAQEKKWIVTELTTESPNLEQAFVRLTMSSSQ